MNTIIPCLTIAGLSLLLALPLVAKEETGDVLASLVESVDSKLANLESSMQQQEQTQATVKDELHELVKRYKASLAHKANHSFTPNCRFTLFDHPRFGPVPAVITTKEVCRDDELTVSYDYVSASGVWAWIEDFF